jgi:hypothetical protein
LIRFVFAVTSRGPLVLMCSDLRQDPVAALELYCVRTWIEVMFHNLKHLIGAFQFRFWSKHLSRHSRTPKANRTLTAPAAQDFGPCNNAGRPTNGLSCSAPSPWEKGTDLFSSILSWSALLPVFNPPPNDCFYFIGKSLGSSQLPPLQRLTYQLPLTRRYRILHEFPVAHRPFIVTIPQSLETRVDIQPIELTPHSNMPPITGPGIGRRIVAHAGTNRI